MAEPTSAWGVTVAEVAALASHADITAGTTADPEFGAANDRRVKTQDVTRWIESVEATVDLKLRKRTALAADAQERLKAAAKTVVLNGAAAYLVDAAYPARAGVGDNSSYGNVLWNRYNTGLAELVELVEEWAAQGGDDNASSALPIKSFFPSTRFTDDMKW